MKGPSVYVLMLLLHAITGVFFHSASMITIRPNDVNIGSDFGFSMGYQNDGTTKLVIGAPRSDFIGKVYICTVQDMIKNITNCVTADIDVEKLANYTRNINPDQYFFLGSSIATTSTNFLTCAPLWISSLKGITMPEKPYGTCFIYANNTAYRYKGAMEQYNKIQKNISNLRLFVGVGWTTLADETNDLYLIAKLPLKGDISSISVKKPLESAAFLMPRKSPRSDKNYQYLSSYYNIGSGMAAGNYFSTSNKTIYAFSMENQEMQGVIAFLKQLHPGKPNLGFWVDSDNRVNISTRDVNTMFGSALCSADLTRDGYSELLVGAPTHTEDDENIETGALHIYIGGDQETISGKVHTILGSKDMARFGSVIAASDIDGDGIPEIFVSAPYEDDGVGALYVLSGYELYNIIRISGSYKNYVSSLKFTQRIQNNELKRFGFSLQVIPNTDGSGYNDLAVGVPGSATVAFLRSLQTINITVTAERLGGQMVRERDNNFTVTVCIKADYHPSSNVTGGLLVKSTIKGEKVYIPHSVFTIDLSKKENITCNDVLVKMDDNDAANYKFTSEATLTDLEKNLKDSDFDPGWVISSPYSKLKTSLDIHRDCIEDCKPNLKLLDLVLSEPDNYTIPLGESRFENVTIRNVSVTVYNDGFKAYGACVRLRVQGAKVGILDCIKERGDYLCLFQQPILRYKERTIDIKLEIKPISNIKKLNIQVDLYEDCHNRNNFTSKSLERPYSFSATDVSVEGTALALNIAEKMLLNNEIVYFEVNHEYTITNNGSVTWVDIPVELEIENTTFFDTVSVGSSDCINQEYEHAYKCKLRLIPGEVKKLTATMHILKEKLKPYLENPNLHISSSVIVNLTDTADLRHSLNTVITYQNELSFGNKKYHIIAIAVVVALLIFATVIYVLHKKGFFRRKKKERLTVLRESIRKRSVRSRSDKTDGERSLHPEIDNEMEIVDDCPFDDPVPQTTPPR